jgi:hypothetical protein
VYFSSSLFLFVYLFQLMLSFSHVGHYYDICCIFCKCTCFTFSLLNDNLTLALLLLLLSSSSLLIGNFDFCYIYYFYHHHHYSDVTNCLAFVLCMHFFHSCSLCNWPLGCWISMQINKNWIKFSSPVISSLYNYWANSFLASTGDLQFVGCESRWGSVKISNKM